MSTPVETVALSLVSHTNVGKTTLARTLLRRDVGVVFDQAHVTELSEAWTLLETDDARLVLWDTPGFGDTVRLMRRLRNENNPLGWFLHQVWDRLGDRALWCNQKALANIREEADVVVYLVSSAEDPADAGYVKHELELLSWLEKPVLVLLNQTGPAATLDELEARWREHVERWDHVRGVLSLDAFTRCWVQEDVLLRRVREVLPESKREAMEGLERAWNGRNLEGFSRSVDALAELLAETAADREALPSSTASRVERKRAMDALAERVEKRNGALLETLIDVHGLDGAAAARARERIEDFVVSGEAPVGVKGGAIWGGLLSGAATGVAADVMSGGLSFGAGMIVGAVVGALGGAGLARGYQLVMARGQPQVSWSTEFLTELTRRSVLRYLAVAHFGRGRGAFHDVALRDEQPAWRAAVENATKDRASALDAGLTTAARTAADSEAPAPQAERAVPADLRDAVDDLVRAVLVDRYPDAKRVFEAHVRRV